MDIELFARGKIMIASQVHLLHALERCPVQAPLPGDLRAWNQPGPEPGACAL